MLKYTLRRLVSIIPLLLLVTIMTFGLTLVVPGDPAATLAGEYASDAQIEAVRQRLGLDQPFVQRYFDWVTDLLRGDLGQSLFVSQSVADATAQRLPITLVLTGSALVVALMIGIPAGIYAALKQGKLVDRIVIAVATLGIAIPSFWLGFLLVLAFAIWNPWFAATGYVSFSEGPIQWFKHIALPAFTLGTPAAANIARQLRGSMIEVMRQDYVRTAFASGLRRRQIIGRFALKNAALPVVTVIGFQATQLLGGSVVIERVFGIPGMGQLAVNAVIRSDIPVVLGVVVVFAVIVVITNLLVDISYGYFNPKLRPT